MRKREKETKRTMKFLGQCEVTYRFRRHLGPRFEDAGVTVRCMYANDYVFSSSVSWPQENYAHIVERGLRDGFEELGYDLEQGIHITLVNIEYHNIDSSEVAFYRAAKCAAKSFADLNFTPRTAERKKHYS